VAEANNRRSFFIQLAKANCNGIIKIKAEFSKMLKQGLILQSALAD